MFESFNQKLVDLRIMAVFMSYCLQFWGALRPDTCLRVMTKNSSIFTLYGHFDSYCTLFWCSMGIYNDPKTQYMFQSYVQKLVVFAFYGRFHELLHTVWGSMGICVDRYTRCMFLGMTKNSSFLC